MPGGERLPFPAQPPDLSFDPPRLPFGPQRHLFLTCDSKTAFCARATLPGPERAVLNGEITFQRVGVSPARWLFDPTRANGGRLTPSAVRGERPPHLPFHRQSTDLCKSPCCSSPHRHPEDFPSRPRRAVQRTQEC